MPTGHRCVVCKTYRYSKNIGKEISFHQFPKDEILRGKWCLAMNLTIFEPEKESYLCSKHFKFSDFDNSPLDRGKQRVIRMLIKGTVPSLYPSGNSSVPSQSQEERHLLALEDTPTSTAPVTLPIANGLQRMLARVQERRHRGCVVCKKSRFSKHIGKEISFHKFPKDEVLRGQWCAAMNLKGFQPKEQSYICSKHFKFSDFDNSPLEKCHRGKEREKRILKRGTVPSLNPSTPSGISISYVPKKSQEERDILAHEDTQTSTASVTLPISHEINVTQLPQSQPPNTSKGVEDDPLAIAANGMDAQTMEEKTPEKKHDVSIEEVDSANAVKRIANLSCGVCKYQAKSEKDLKQHLFEEIRQLQVSKAPNVQDSDGGKCKDKPDLPDKDQNQSKTSTNVTENSTSSQNKVIIRCTECKYESKREGEIQKVIFQDHQVHKFQRKPINKTDDDQKCKKSETKNDSSTKKKAIPPCGLCNYQAKSEDDLKQHLFEEIRQQRLKKSKKEQGNQADELHRNCSNFFIDMASIQDGAIVPHCGCS